MVLYLKIEIKKKECNIFDMMLSIIFYRNRELNCHPDKIKNSKNFWMLELKFTWMVELKNFLDVRVEIFLEV